MVRHTLANIDPNLTVIDLHSLDYQVAGNFTEERLVSRLTALFGALALVLASVGLYGITSYQVARRTSESGSAWRWRGTARGSSRWSCAAPSFKSDWAWQSEYPLQYSAARAMGDQLYKVSIYDPLTLAAAIVVLAACAAIAGHRSCAPGREHRADMWRCASSRARELPLGHLHREPHSSAQAEIAQPQLSLLYSISRIALRRAAFTAALSSKASSGC